MLSKNLLNLHILKRDMATDKFTYEQVQGQMVDLDPRILAFATEYKDESGRRIVALVELRSRHRIWYEKTKKDAIVEARKRLDRVLDDELDEFINRCILSKIEYVGNTEYGGDYNEDTA